MAKNDSSVTTLDDLDPVAKPNAKFEVKSPGTQREDMSGKMVNITIYPSSEEGGKEPVFLGHNEFAYQIPRGTPWPVPAEVAQVIADAVTVTYELGQGGKSIEMRTPRFAHSITPIAA